MDRPPQTKGRHPVLVSSRESLLWALNFKRRKTFSPPSSSTLWLRTSTLLIVKERARSIYNTLPYARLPKMMIIELLYFVVMWMNSFPVVLGVSSQLSPREFILRHKLDAKLHCRAPFGAYCEVHDNDDVTNTLLHRTHPAICLGPTGNLQGTYKFLLLDTGKHVLRRNFTELPLTSKIQIWPRTILWHQPALLPCAVPPERVLHQNVSNHSISTPR